MQKMPCRSRGNYVDFGQHPEVLILPPSRRLGIACFRPDLQGTPSRRWGIFARFGPRGSASLMNKNPETDGGVMQGWEALYLGGFSLAGDWTG